MGPFPHARVDLVVREQQSSGRQQQMLGATAGDGAAGEEAHTPLFWVVSWCLALRTPLAAAA